MSSNLAISLVVGAAVTGALRGLTQVKTKTNDLSRSIEKQEAKFQALGLQVQKYTKLGMTAPDFLNKKYLKLGHTLDQLKAKQDRIAKKEILSPLREELTGKAVKVGAGIAVFSQPIKSAIEFESAMADVKKVVDFDTPKQFQEMRGDILELTRTIPMTATELTQIAASGGQLGIARKDIKSFTAQIAKMSVAFDMSAEDSSDSMAKLANVYKIPINEISNLGDAINDLSNSSPAKASEIVRVLGRVGGVAKQFGLSANAATALGGAFIALGKPPEVAGTAINGMLTKLMTADKQGKKFKQALKSMGMSAKELKDNIAKNGQQALVDFLHTVKKMPKKQQMGILTDLFGLEYGDDVAILVNNTELLEKNLNRLSGKDYLGSMQKEFDARAATTGNNLTLLGNSISEIAIVLGDSMLPAINSVISGIKPFIYSFSKLLKETPYLAETLMGCVAGFLSLKAGSIIGGFGLNIFKTSIITLQSTLGGLAKTIGYAKRYFSFFSHHTKRATLASFNFGKSLVISSFSKLKTGILFATNGIRSFSKLLAGQFIRTLVGAKNITLWFAKGSFSLGKALSGKLLTGLKLASRGILFLGRALLMNPIGLLITGIGIAAFVIYKYWTPIKAFFGDLWTSVTQKFTQASQSLSQLWTGVSNFFSEKWQNIQNFFSSGIGNISATILNWSPLGLFYQAFQGVMNWFGIDLPNKFSEFGSNIISGLTSGIKNAWNTAKETVTGLGDSVSGWFKKKLNINSPSRVFMGFGKSTVKGLAMGISKNSNLASDATTKMADTTIKAMPRILPSPLMKGIASVGLHLATNFSPEKIGKMLMPKPQEVISSQKIVKRISKPNPEMNILGKIFSGLWDKFKGFGTVVTKLFEGFDLPRTLMLGTQLLTNGRVDLSPIFNQTTKLKTPDFNAKYNQIKSEPSLFSDYQPLNRNVVSHTETTHQNNTQQGGVVIHFSPTLKINTNAEQNIKGQVQQAIKMSFYELEKNMRRIEDHRQWRSY